MSDHLAAMKFGDSFKIGFLIEARFLQIAVSIGAKKMPFTGGAGSCEGRDLASQIVNQMQYHEGR